MNVRKRSVNRQNPRDDRQYDYDECDPDDWIVKANARLQRRTRHYMRLLIHSARYRSRPIRARCLYWHDLRDFFNSCQFLISFGKKSATAAFSIPGGFALAAAAFLLLFMWQMPPWLVVALCALGAVRRSTLAIDHETYEPFVLMVLVMAMQQRRAGMSATKSISRLLNRVFAGCRRPGGRRREPNLHRRLPGNKRPYGPAWTG